MAFNKTDNKRQNIISSAQTLTGVYADISPAALGLGGPFVNVMDCEAVTLWLRLDINSSTGVKLKMVGVNAEADSVVYQPVIKNVSPSIIAIQPSEISITNNSDQDFYYTFSVADQVPFVKFQIMATVVGAPAGQILAAGISFTSVV